jgi:DNA-binding NarL/FixJ family response regulator
VRAAVQMPLTRREREVAVLAAQGVSSRDIGDRLYVSARTIESHLARIYHKLGIHGRAELAQTIHTSGRSSEHNL